MRLQPPGSKNVLPVMFNDFENKIKLVGLNKIYRSPERKKTLQEELINTVALLKNWLMPCLDLSEYDFTYPSHGITDAINHWMATEDRQIYIFAGDYAWPIIVNSEIKIIKNLGEIKNFNDSVLYVSNPSAINGCFRSDWDDIIHSQIPIVLDVAYLGTTSKKQILIERNVEKIFFSFSKSFGCNLMRVGWRFERKNDSMSDKLILSGYIPTLHLLLTDLICNEYSLDHYYKLLLPLQNKICSDLNLQPSHSFLVGYDMQNKYPEFLREDNLTCRVPLGTLYAKYLKNNDANLF